METVNRILNLIKSKGINEQQFLSDLGFNRTLLSDWKSGKSKSYKKHAAEIAEYFNVTTDYLLTGADNKISPANEAEDKVPEDFILMARKADEIPPEKRKQLYKFLNSTIDTFLEAIKNEDSNK